MSIISHRKDRLLLCLSLFLSSTGTVMAQATEPPAALPTTPTQATPTPAQATPTPAQATPTPTQATPTPTQATPTPTQATPTPTQATPTPAQATPTTAQAAQDVAAAGASPLVVRTAGLSPVFASSGISAQSNYAGISVGDLQLTAITTTLFAQLLARNGFGGYASLAAAYVSAEGEDGTESRSAFGGVELGAALVRGGPQAAFSARAGVVLPTAPGFDDEGAAAAVFGSFVRLADLPQMVPDSTWLRLTVVSAFEKDGWLASAELGLDAPLSTPMELQADPLVRASGSIGFLTGAHQLTAEISNTIDLDDDIIHTVGASYRWRGAWEPFLSVQQTFGIKSDTIGIDLGVSLGVAVPLK